ncbi:MAG: hypothetical protein GY943_26825 [Chloroflexi bacterium]|nr:hypothetical protein [Chloroflexota bacterium]
MKRDVTDKEKELFQAMELLIERFELNDLPQKFNTFLEVQKKNSHRLHRASSGQSLIDFFKTLQLPNINVLHFFSLESELRFQIEFDALLKLSPKQIYTYLVDNLADLFELQQAALDSEMETGFNRHGKRHVCSVTKTAVSLLEEFDLISKHRDDGLYRKEVIIGGLLHDIGNLISRKHHNLYGAYLAALLFTNYTIDEVTLESFLTVLEIIAFHEVGFGMQAVSLSELTPATLCVIIGDKTDVGVSRISAKSNVPEAIMDAHVLINLLVSKSTIQRKIQDDGSFYWTIYFKTKIDATQFDFFSSLLKVTGRVKYPKEWTDIYKEWSIEYLFVFQSTFLEIYLSRLYLTLHSVFSLYRSVDNFHLVINDTERNISLERSFRREDYLQQIYTLGKLFYKEQWAAQSVQKALALALDM